MTVRDRLVFAFPGLAVFLTDRPSLWLNRRRDGLVWLFLGWIHVGVWL